MTGKRYRILSAPPQRHVAPRDRTNAMIPSSHMAEKDTYEPVGWHDETLYKFSMPRRNKKNVLSKGVL